MLFKNAVIASLNDPTLINDLTVQQGDLHHNTCSRCLFPVSLFSANKKVVCGNISVPFLLDTHISTCLAFHGMC